MKSTTILVGAAAFASLVAAQPHRAHLARHAHQHAKRDDVVVVVNTVYAEATAPAVIVYVDQNGVPVSTSTEGAVAATPSPSPIVAAQVVTSAESSPTSAVEDVQTTSTPEPVEATSSEVAAPSATASSTPDSKKGFGFSYSPYHANGNCKNQAEVDSDFATIGDEFSLVRTYGVDCNQTATVLSAAKAKGLKLFAGIYDITDLSGAVDTIVSAANGDWSSFDTVSVGNEIVNGGGSAATVIAAIGTVRTLLKAAGYTGKVTTVDTLVAARANPGLCDASDVCTVNCHPFFDGQVTADGAGDFLETQIPTLRDVLSDKNKEIIITETGWPWKGDTNGAAVPSVANQEAAISSIKSKFASKPSSVVLFTVFNDMWKKNNAAQFNAEQFWGFLGDAPSG